MKFKKISTCQVNVHEINLRFYRHLEFFGILIKNQNFHVTAFSNRDVNCGMSSGQIQFGNILQL